MANAKNNLEYASVLQDALDSQLVQQATSGWMEKNAGSVRYDGGKYVKLPVSVMTGLGSYNREKGEYPLGSVTLSYETKELKMDRAAQFYFDRNDVDETNYLTEAAAVMAQFQKEHVIPEVDAYRYSEIARQAIAAENFLEEALDKEVVFSKILGALRKIQNATGIDKKELVITVPFPVYELLEQSDEITRTLSVQQFDKGEVSTEVSSINGVPVIAVSSERMMLNYEFLSGADGVGFGFKAEENSPAINYLIMPRFAPIAVSKTDNLKIFTPDENQDGDGWKTQYRKYHDVWLKKKDLAAVFVSVFGEALI